MSLLADLLVLGLATWRISSLLQYERGPWAVFTRLRERVGVVHNEDGEPMGWPDNEPGRLARCLDCGSVWIGAGLVVLYWRLPDVATLVSLPFALSAVATGIGAWLNGKSDL